MTEPFNANQFRQKMAEQKGGASQASNVDMPQPLNPPQGQPQPFLAHQTQPQNFQASPPHIVHQPPETESVTRKPVKPAKSPILPFMAGVVVGVIGATIGLVALNNFVSETTDKEFAEVVAAANAEAPESAVLAESIETGDLSELQKQLQAAKGLQSPNP